MGTIQTQEHTATILIQPPIQTIPTITMAEVLLTQILVIANIKTGEMNTVTTIILTLLIRTGEIVDIQFI